MPDTEANPEISTVSGTFTQHKPEIAAWKKAHVLMWQRWQEFIDFPALKKSATHGEVLDVGLLCDAIGMLYGEYLTAHISEYNELEAQLLEQFKRELNKKEPGPEEQG